MGILLWAYIALYGMGMAFLFLAEFTLVKRQERDSVATTVLDVLIAGGLLAGMLLLAAGVASPALKSAWKPASVALVGLAAWTNLRDRRRMICKDSEFEGDRNAVRAADFSAWVLMLPSAALNPGTPFRTRCVFVGGGWLREKSGARGEAAEVLAGCVPVTKSAAEAGFSGTSREDAKRRSKPRGKANFFFASSSRLRAVSP